MEERNVHSGSEFRIPNSTFRIMLDGPAITDSLQACGITHVVWIPDGFLGTWESALLRSSAIKLIRCCREGEAIAVAGGLLLGSAKPVVVVQCTGLFEAGDALRNIVHDLGLPLILIVGVRSQIAFEKGKSTDNCPAFIGPIVDAWKLPRAVLDPNSDGPGELIAAIRTFQRDNCAGVILIAE